MNKMMKISNLLKSLPMGIRLFKCIGKYNNYYREIGKLRKGGDVEKEREFIAFATGVWIDEVMDIFHITLNVEGRENIPMEEPCVFICNHEGYGDIFVLFKALKGKQIGFITKEEIRRVPYFGKWITAVRGVFISRGDLRGALETIREGISYLKQGFSLVIFPEGTRSHGPVMNGFKGGSFKLATRAKVPVVPVALNGTYHLCEENDYIRNTATVDIVIHPPVETASLDSRGLAELPRRVENIIRGTFDKLVIKEEQRLKGGSRP